MTTKLLSLAEAICRFVPDHGRVVLGTALESCIPFAAGHELIRQSKKALTLIGPISDVLFDQLILVRLAPAIIEAVICRCSVRR